jgi:hypothetical protein
MDIPEQKIENQRADKGEMKYAGKTLERKPVRKRWIAVDSSVEEHEKFTCSLFGYDNYAEVIEVEIAGIMEESFAVDMLHKEFLFW